jgi:hypothetical protein
MKKRIEKKRATHHKGDPRSSMIASMMMRMWKRVHRVIRRRRIHLKRAHRKDDQGS